MAIYDWPEYGNNSSNRHYFSHTLFPFHDIVISAAQNAFRHFFIVLHSGTPETDPMEISDAPVTGNPGSTGALNPLDEIWGGSYMDQSGHWVVWLTENTPENQARVFAQNPDLLEDDTVFTPTKSIKQKHDPIDTTFFIRFFLSMT